MAPQSQGAGDPETAKPPGGPHRALAIVRVRTLRAYTVCERCEQNRLPYDLRWRSRRQRTAASRQPRASAAFERLLRLYRRSAPSTTLSCSGASPRRISADASTSGVVDL